MSEHKTGKSNWSVAQKKLYRDRRDRGLNGQPRPIKVFQSIYDKKGKLVDIIPISDKTYSGGSPYLRGISPGRASRKQPEAPMAMPKLAARSQGRGDK